MKKILKNIIYVNFAMMSILYYNLSNAAISSDEGKIKGAVRGSTESADQYIQTIIGNVFLFLALIWVLIFIYAWFQYLTAAWDDEKVKKAKTMIIQAIIWLAIIFSAYSIINLVIVTILKPLSS